MDFNSVCEILRNDKTIQWKTSYLHGHLRGYQKGEPFEFCPLTAVCYLETGAKFATTETSRANEHMVGCLNNDGLTKEAYFNTIALSDNRYARQYKNYLDGTSIYLTPREIMPDDWLKLQQSCRLAAYPFMV